MFPFRFTLTFALSLLFWTTFAHAAPRSIRVGLITAGAPITFYADSAIMLSDAEQEGRSLVIFPRQAITISSGPQTVVTKGALRWRGTLVVRTAGGSHSAWRVVQVRPAGGAARVSTNGKSPVYQRAYRGAFEVGPRVSRFAPERYRGPLRLINVVPIDQYLKGVVSWEMQRGAPLEAFKAQALCARSETLAKINAGRHRSDGFDICDFDHCQGYAGTENENTDASLAVDQTARLAIFYKGRIADAVYGTNSGGITASTGDVWLGTPEPYLRRVNDFSPTRHRATAQVLKVRMTEADWARYCTQNLPAYAQPTLSQVRALALRRRSSATARALYGPEDLPEFYRWTRTLAPRALAQEVTASTREQALRTRRAPATPMESATEIRVLERAPSGHIKRLQIVGRAQRGLTTRTFAGDSQIRAMLSGQLGSTTALPSSTFVVQTRRDAKGQLSAFVLRGAGWGHGVGMCQRGAQNHAREGGWTARQIIKFYYRGVDVRRAY